MLREQCEVNTNINVYEVVFKFGTIAIPPFYFDDRLGALSCFRQAPMPLCVIQG